MFVTAAVLFGIVWLLGVIGVYDLGARKHVPLLYSVICLLVVFFKTIRLRDAGIAPRRSPSNE
jgi:hypothetical protein